MYALPHYARNDYWRKLGVPTTNRGRPPGRRDRRRPPEGRAVTATNKRAALRAATPPTREAIRFLKANGEKELAAAVATVLKAALEFADSRDRAATRESGLEQNRAVSVAAEFRDHVHAVKGDADLVDVVTTRMRDFLAGTWMPRKEEFDAGTWTLPLRGYGSIGPTVPRKNLNMRIPTAVWTATNELGEDPAAVAERGYKLTAPQVAIAALEEAFGLPDTQDSTTA